MSPEELKKLIEPAITRALQDGHRVTGGIWGLAYRPSIGTPFPQPNAVDLEVSRTNKRCMCAASAFFLYPDEQYKASIEAQFAIHGSPIYVLMWLLKSEEAARAFLNGFDGTSWAEYLARRGLFFKASEEEIHAYFDVGRAMTDFAYAEAARLFPAPPATQEAP